MARFLTATLLLAFVAAVAAQTAVPTATPTAPAPTKTPTTPTPRPTIKKTPSCKSGFYLKESTKTCLQCASTKSTGSRHTVGRSTCYNPTASGFDTRCEAATLTGAKIRATNNKSKSVSCIPSKPFKGVVVIYLPRKGTYKLSFLTAGSYIKSSFRLNGSIPASTLRGRVVSVSEKFQGATRLKISFNDKFGTLKKKKGKTIYLRGVARRTGSLLDYCFQVPFKVCK